MLIVIQTFLFLLLILSIAIDIEIPVILNTPTHQLLIAIIIVFIIVVIDEIIGFLIGLIFLVIYFKYYQNKFNNIGKNNQNELKQPLIFNNYDMFSSTLSNEIQPEQKQKTEKISKDVIKYDSINNCIEMPYISEELLDKAQNNIYDINNYTTEIKSDINAYGIQGLNSDKLHYLAYDKTDYKFINYNEMK